LEQPVRVIVNSNFLTGPHGYGQKHFDEAAASRRYPFNVLLE
jgi:hypothetical protein